VMLYVLLPALVIALSAGAGYLQWRQSSARDADSARIEAVAAAKDTAVALLSYKFDTVEKDLGAAGDRLTGAFQDSYAQLTRDEVIPAAKKRHISAQATVPAASTVSASASHAVVLLFVNQTVTVEKEPPSDTASSVKVTLEKRGDRWLVSAFDPV
jgi:Mce-associated membrane protein